MLRPGEVVRVAPGFCFVLIVALGLLYGNIWGWGDWGGDPAAPWIVFSLWITLGGFFGTWFDCEEGARADAMRESRVIRYRDNVVKVLPHGEEVIVKHYQRMDGSRYAKPYVDTQRFHAEDEADAAHAYVAKLREKPQGRQDSLDDAVALAQVLSKSGR